MTNEQATAVIVGGGVVGASLGLALARLVEKQTRHGKAPLVLMAKPRQHIAAQPPRYYTLNQSSMDLLRKLGVSISATPFDAMQVYDLAGGGALDYHADTFGADALGYTANENHCVDALGKSLDSTDLLSTSELVSIAREGDMWRCTNADGNSYQTPLVFAVDGSHSRVVEQIQLAGSDVATHTWDSGDVALVASLDSDRPYRPLARQWFSHRGVVAFLPDDKEGYSLVWSTRGEYAKNLIQGEDGYFVQALEEATAGMAGKLALTSARAFFPLRTHVATKLLHDGVVLLGNTACTIHPLAGQGANLALWSIDRLVASLQAYGLTDKALQRWQASVLPVHYGYWMLMRQLRLVFRSATPGTVLLRSWLMRRIFNKELPASLVADLAMYGVRIESS